MQLKDISLISIVWSLLRADGHATLALRLLRDGGTGLTAQDREVVYGVARSGLGLLAGVPVDTTDSNVRTAIRGALPRNAFGNTIDEFWWRIVRQMQLCAADCAVRPEWTQHVEAFMDANDIDWEEFAATLSEGLGVRFSGDSNETWGDITRRAHQESTVQLCQLETLEETPDQKVASFLLDSPWANTLKQLRSKEASVTAYRFIKVQFGSDMAIWSTRLNTWAWIELLSPILAVVGFALLVVSAWIAFGKGGLLLVPALALFLVLLRPARKGIGKIASGYLGFVSRKAIANQVDSVMKRFPGDALVRRIAQSMPTSETLMKSLVGPP